MTRSARLERIINYLIDHYDEAISKELQTLTGSAFLIPIRSFKEVTGTTP